MKKTIRKVLVINSGSSSLKYQLFDMKNEERLAKGLVERIGAGGPANHAEALKQVVADLGNPTDIDAIGHRVLHGAEVFKDSAKVTKSVMTQLKKLVKFGPLHMPPNLGGIEACEKIFKGVPNLATRRWLIARQCPPLILSITRRWASANTVSTARATSS